MVSGAELSTTFYEQAVRPIVDDVAPGVAHLAGRLGTGSDVLGLDDDMSADHDFGCRLTLLVDDRDRAVLDEVDQALSARLPDDVDGWPTRFATSWDQHVTHRVDLHTCHDFAATRLGVDLRAPLDTWQWLSLTGQSVLEVVGGPVFHDDTDGYSDLRRSLDWYPDDVWRYVLAAGWRRISQELPLVGRAGQHGDELGSRLIAARLCRDILHLTFAVEREWMPHPKRAGTALQALSGGDATARLLAAVHTSSDWRRRQHSLAAAIGDLAERHRDAGVVLPSEVVIAFFDRPFLTVADEVPVALQAQIGDARIRDSLLIGSIEQWCDNVDVLTDPTRRVSATRALIAG